MRILIMMCVIVLWAGLASCTSEPQQSTDAERSLGSNLVGSEVKTTARANHYENRQDEAILAVTIVPPVYQSWGAYLIYSLLAFATFAVIYRSRSNRLQMLRQSLDSEQLEATHVRLLDPANSRFMANISHDLRTPLTLTIGPLDDLLAGLHGPLSSDVTAQLALARRSAVRILDLVNQKLDVERPEAERVQGLATELDLSTCVAQIAMEVVAPAERRERVSDGEPPEGGVTGDEEKDRELPSRGMLAAAASGGDGAIDAGTQVADDVTTVLVVDDNPEFRGYVCRHLAPRYRVIEAADGLEGLEHARAQLPDLVLSDVLMPKMSGFTLCRTLKKDPETEFIPVVLLTARADTEGRIEGLGERADDYLTKPFDVRELRARVDNLIASRRRLHERLHSAGTRPGSPTLGGLHAAPVEVDSADSIILRRIREAVEAHLGDDEFSVERLASVLGVSRGHLHRQLKELLGQTPSGTIRIMRLQRAAQLLIARSGTVSEVAYAVGFKSVAHFSNVFDAYYGCRPSLYPPASED